MVSLRGRALIAKYRLMGKKRIFSDLHELHRSVESRESESAQIPDEMFERYEVDRVDIRGHYSYTLHPLRRDKPYHLFYLHGGAYIHQVEDAHWRFLSRLIDESGCAVTLPVYPLAPDYQYDETLEVVEGTWEATVGREGPRHQVIMGDSAGGGLTLHLAQWLRQRQRPQPRRLVLLSPWLDITSSHPSMPELDPRDPFLSLPGLREAGRMYAGDLDPHDPRVSPLYGELDGLAPMTVMVGTRDVLLSDARRLRELAAERGVRIDYEEYPGMFHGWVLQSIPEARRATERLVRTLDSGVPHAGTV
ncbi:acetyl esterase/lipase [Saccharopolyspora erythraea NRRL 2338]|uniref:Esterase/lipase n=2 Tax=Saccharopolyspora erythraea TaxID=1836 RepID=A4FHB3_SACEN|nr:alpha/beta hydrolase [Saccharopolyspora erythraea]EQD86845.1 esterase [Saccharopolyspora erythraea D]PFG97138.1 acetyl esterase/lipase [Saccharopolyspora erythraea NRRL 2338]QRK87341.1 alpha/beta hydrolase [Saccharopolyspora erythraea]CAM03438.1 esterase/lipase [Saccharopolyspora erythraea NRRL 2338]